MSKLNEFELKVVNKEIKDLTYKEVAEIFSDCVFLKVSVELNKLLDVVSAISYIPSELQREVAWDSAKYTFKDVFSKSTIAVAPRYHICEIPIEKDEKMDRHCIPFYNELNEQEKSELKEEAKAEPKKETSKLKK